MKQFLRRTGVAHVKDVLAALASRLRVPTFTAGVPNAPASRMPDELLPSMQAALARRTMKSSNGTCLTDLIWVRLCERYQLNPEQFIIVIQHPVTTDLQSSLKMFQIVVETVIEFDRSTLFLYPNTDAGSKEMTRIMHQYGLDGSSQRYPKVGVETSLH